MRACLPVVVLVAACDAVSEPSDTAAEDDSDPVDTEVTADTDGPDTDTPPIGADTAAPESCVLSGATVDLRASPWDWRVNRYGETLEGLWSTPDGVRFVVRPGRGWLDVLAPPPPPARLEDVSAEATLTVASNGDVWTRAGLVPGEPEGLWSGNERVGQPTLFSVWASGLAGTRDEAERTFVFTDTGVPRPALGDLDGDGNLDVLGVAEDAGDLVVRVWWGPFPPGASYALDAHDVVARVAGLEPAGEPVVEDLDGDGAADLAVAAAEGGEPRGMRARVVVVVAGPFAAGSAARTAVTTRIAPVDPPTVPPRASFGWTLAAADVDGDGARDLVVGDPSAEEEDGAVYVFRGPLAAGGLATSAAWATLVGARPAGGLGGSLFVLDADMDGRDDLMVSELDARRRRDPKWACDTGPTWDSGRWVDADSGDTAAPEPGCERRHERAWSMLLFADLVSGIRTSREEDLRVLGVDRILPADDADADGVPDFVAARLESGRIYRLELCGW